MKNILLLCCCIYASASFAQLDKVTPMVSIVHDAAKLENLNILMNTKDFTSTLNPALPDLFPTTVQLAHISAPFPPIWYQVGLKHLIPGLTGSDFYLGPELNESKHLSYSFVVVPDSITGQVFDGFVFIDTTTMEPVDTLTGADFSLDSIIQAVDDHECVEDVHGNKMFFSSIRTKVDGRCLSGIPADSLMTIVVQYIVILDSANNIKFVWNPLAHLSPCEMIWDYRNSSTFYSGAINWSHGNSLRWANDGNILYSYRHIGLGKINSTTGDIMWKLGGKDSSNVNYIPVPDSITYALQHDFYQRIDGKYSLFSNGNTTTLTHMEGLIYDINEAGKTVQLVDRYKPQPDCRSNALGSFDTYNGMYFLNRGFNLCSFANQIVDIVNVSDKSPVAEIYTVAKNFSYRAHPTLWNISRRPSITQHGDTLRTDSISGLYNYTWYSVTDTTAQKVGTGLKYQPVSSGRYVVEAKAGTGAFTSFLLSDVANYLITGIKNNLSDKISFFYNHTDNIANIELKKSGGILRIISINGEEIQKISLNRYNNQIYFKEAAGVYIFDITAEDEHIVAKAFVN